MPTGSPARLEQEFERAPANETIARELADAYRKSNRPDDAATVQRRSLDAQLTALGCDKQRTLAMGERLVNDGDAQAGLKLVADFTQRCGEWLRLEWVAMSAHEDLGHWKEAAAIATRLIQADPEDSDYWWCLVEGEPRAGV